LFSWQGVVLILGFIYIAYIVGVFFNEVRQDVMESYAIWREERKERI
jgi:hypothetical protein